MRRTPLYDKHLAAGGRMVDFAGWEMPVQYTGILDEHRAVREAVGMFDISHMGEFFVRGENAAPWLDSLLTNNVASLSLGQAHYSLMLNDQGGVIDDLIVYRTGEREFLLVVNAAKIDEDFAWLSSHLPNCDPAHIGNPGFIDLVNCSDDYSAIAVQGPRAPEILSVLFPGHQLTGRNRVQEFTSPQSYRIKSSCGELAVHAPLTPESAAKAPSTLPFEPRVFVITTGYTGEHGFELVIPNAEAESHWDRLLAAGVKPCGLGSRDTLRLEMCYPLNGNDLAPDKSPLEAGLGFFVDLNKSFRGSHALTAQKQSGLTQRLAAIRVDEKSPPIRPHYPIIANDTQVAETTSGALSPSLNCGIALAYLPFELAKPGQPLEIEVRGRRYKATVVKKPFYQPNS